MPKSFQTSLFVFRRDLRLTDNTGLRNALKTSNQVLPCFILDPRLIGPPAQHLNAIELMTRSLQDLAQQLMQRNGHLYLFTGKAEQVIRLIIKSKTIDAIFINRDYTPFSRMRDAHIQQYCDQANIPFFSFSDTLLNEPEMVLKSDNEPYVVFTPFFRKARQLAVAVPKKNLFKTYLTDFHPMEMDHEKLPNLIAKKNTQLAVQGGRANAQKILSSLSRFGNYAIERDIPAIHGTTHLSAYLKFGVVSIREVYHAVKKQLGIAHPLIRQLYWRDFYTHIAFHFPHVFRQAFKTRYEKIPWNNNPDLFETWCKGRTGFPIVDAGMRELNTTGWMHNRVRMIVASFLTKDLHIDWRWGERYFAKHLVDYDPSINNGNWQWAASTGVDAQPYFRIFNPWRQQEKYDKDCEYIKQWIPELSQVEPKIIHQWFKPTKFDSQISYPKPIVDHRHESQYSKELFTAKYSI